MATQFAFGKIVTNGLVLALDAADTNSYTSGSSIWRDLSGNERSGTLINGPAFSNNSIVFDGTNDYINTSFDLSWNNTNSVTISMFIRPTSLAVYYPFIGKGPANWEWQLMQNNTSLDFVYWNTGGGHTNGPIPTIPNFFLSTNQFVNMTMVWNHVDNNYYFYRNSILVNTTTWVNASINQNRTDGIKIGGDIYRWGSGGSYWNGTISNIQIYNRALPQSEILQNYNALKSRFGIF
jgi:hypothetical protein